MLRLTVTVQVASLIYYWYGARVESIDPLSVGRSDYGLLPRRAVTSQRTFKFAKNGLLVPQV